MSKQGRYSIDGQIEPNFPLAQNLNQQTSQRPLKPKKSGLKRGLTMKHEYNIQDIPRNPTDQNKQYCQHCKSITGSIGLTIPNEKGLCCLTLLCWFGWCCCLCLIPACCGCCCCKMTMHQCKVCQEPKYIIDDQ